MLTSWIAKVVGRRVRRIRLGLPTLGYWRSLKMFLPITWPSPEQETCLVRRGVYRAHFVYPRCSCCLMRTQPSFKPIGIKGIVRYSVDISACVVTIAREVVAIGCEVVIWVRQCLCCPTDSSSTACNGCVWLATCFWSLFQECIPGVNKGEISFLSKFPTNFQVSYANWAISVPGAAGANYWSKDRTLRHPLLRRKFALYQDFKFSVSEKTSN
jgi:hypothetical protein